MILKLNDIDITAKYEIYLEDKSLQALRLPAAAKKPIENKSRLIHGYEFIPEPLKYQHRSITLVFAFGYRKRKNIDKTDTFTDRVDQFVADLTNSIPSQLQVNDTTYNLVYQSCRTLNTIKDTAGTLAVVFDEPNPTNRIKHVI